MLKFGVTRKFAEGRLVYTCRSAGYACLLMTFFAGAAIPVPCAADEPEQKKEEEEEKAAVVDPAEQKSKYSGYLRAAGDYHRKRLHLAMQLRSEEIDRAVKLNDTQSKKISIAAKGAVDRVIDRWLEQMLANSDLEIQFGQMPAEQAKGSLIGMGAELDVEEVTQEEIWKNGVNQQFSAAQRQFYEAMVAERRAFERGVSISQLVVQLDHLLRFSEKQRQGMTKLLDGALDEDFTFENSNSEGAIFARAIMNQRVVAGAAVDPFAPAEGIDASNPLAMVKDDEAGKVLSETQLQRWQVLRKNPSALFSGRGGGDPWIQGGAGNIFIGGGVIEINGRVIVE